MVVENQQVTGRLSTVVEACPAIICPHSACRSQPSSGRHQRHGMPRFGRRTHQRERRRARSRTGDAEFSIRTDPGQGRIAAMNHQILQLHRPTAGNARREQGFVQVPAAWQQVVAHEDAAHNVVDERQLTVTAEITGA